MNKRPLQIIHMAFMMSILIYLGIGYFRDSFMHVQPVSMEMLNTLRLLFSCIFIGSLLTVSMVTAKMRAQNPGNLMTPHIVKLAFYESGALLGLILSFMGGSFVDQLCLSIPALLLMGLAFPR